MGLKLSGEDRIVIYALRGELKKKKQIPVLQNYKSHRIDQTNGVILVSCGDCDQSPDIFKHKIEMQQGQRSDPRIHSLLINGGALRLVKNSPTNRPDSTFDQDLIDEVRNSAMLKNITTVALYAHIPCGHGLVLSNLNFLQVLGGLIEAKKRVKQECQPLVQHVACFLHIFDDDEPLEEDKRRTYFVSRERLEQLLRGKDLNLLSFQQQTIASPSLALVG